MKYITSVNNPEIKKIVRLHSAAGRKKYKLFIAQGIRAITGFLDPSFTLHSIYSTEDHYHKFFSQLNHYPISENLITIVPEHIIKKISPTATASGIVAVFNIPTLPAWNLLSSGIVLANITDPGNMGTLIRTTAALNLKTVVIINESVDPWSPKVVQATAGALSMLTIFQCTWEELLLYTRKFNIMLAGLVVQNGKPLDSISLANTQQTLLVVGNEAHGLPLEWQQSCNMLVSLPMPGNTESLNAAVAGSIALYLTHIFNAQKLCLTNI